MAIAVVIFVLGCFTTVAWAMRDRTADKERRASWHLAGLVAMLLQIRAMAARDKARENARTHEQRRGPLPGVRPGEMP